MRDYAAVAREMIEACGYPAFTPEHVNSLAAFLAWWDGGESPVSVQVRRDPPLVALAGDDEV